MGVRLPEVMALFCVVCESASRRRDVGAPCPLVFPTKESAVNHCERGMCKVSVPLLLLAAVLAGIAGTGEAGDRFVLTEQHQDDSSRCGALIDALEAYEGSIESLRWKQISFTPPSSQLGQLQWTILEESERYRDQQWRWFHKSLFHGLETDTLSPVVLDSVYGGDGVLRLTLDERSGQGMLTKLDEFFAAGCHLMRSLGGAADFDDFVRARPLSVLLRSGKQLSYLAPGTLDPWPGVRSSEPVRSKWIDVEVRLDPEHGFIPRAVKIYDKRYDEPAEINRVLTVTMAGDVWLPRTGVLMMYYFRTLEGEFSGVSPNRVHDFELAQRLVGLPQDLALPEIRSVLAEAQQVTLAGRDGTAIRAPLNYSASQEPLGSPQFYVAYGFVANAVIGLHDIAAQVPDNARMFDGLTGRMLSGEQTKAWFVELRQTGIPEKTSREEPR